jgi:transcriptional regulator with XRE-family HTH domain
MDDKQRAIGARLQASREARQWSQLALAQMAGVTRDQLSGVEYGRNPLRYGLAERVCRILRISQRWLAEGKDPMNYVFTVSPNLRRQIPKRLLFSEAYDHFLKSLIEKHVEENPAISDKGINPSDLKSIHDAALPHIGAVGKAKVAEFATGLITEILSLLPPHLLQDFYKCLALFVRNYRNVRVDEINKFSKIRPRVRGKFGLTNVTQVGNTPPVRYGDLLRKLCKLTESHGKKAELAAFMQVPMPRISEWLAGKREPRAESTLRLLEWVRAEEAKQTKSPGSARTPPEQKTRMKKSRHENLKSSPP